MDTSDITIRLSALAQKVATNAVANRCLSAFVLADFKGRLPKTFMDSYGLKRINLTSATSGSMFEYPHLRDVLYQPN